ncbi:hypothetical protein CSKR_113598 [Clonorchis sinensis]|uniref:Uncharacterized protein n=1 Tax=Clonorchis sinensis TaxID=79923 RepID=A0A8T1MWK3_CLOSI|nr:hypothetical protein CSKR_113598 [Clonorchis sinensis]
MAVTNTDIFINLRESRDNLRSEVRPRTACSTAKSARPKQVAVKVNVQPHARLRLEEAFENAARSQETHIFSTASITKPVLRWQRKPVVENEEEQSKSHCVVADLIYMKQPKEVVKEPRHLVVKGEEAQNNERRARGQLSLKALTKEESSAACSEDIRIRCAGVEALQNLCIGQRGQGVQKLLDSRLQSEPMPAARDAKRAVTTEEARDNWRRDHIKEAGQMNDILDQGWPNNFRAKKNRDFSEPHAPKLHLASGNNSPPDTRGSAMAAIMGKHVEDQLATSSPTAGRYIPYSAAPNAAREGAAMAERLGLSRPGPHYPGDCEEISRSTQNAITSLDMRQSAVKPKVKPEGIENALRGHGTLSLANFPPKNLDQETRPVARVRLEGAQIAKSSQGDATKFLLSHDRLSVREHARPRITASARSVAHHARGGAARECLNPTRTKWSGKVHWKRRPVPPVHCTF